MGPGRPPRPCGSQGKGSIPRHDPGSAMPLRKDDAPLQRRTFQGLSLSLLRLPATDRLAVQRGRLLSAGERGAWDRSGDSLSPSVRQRSGRDVSLLPGMRLESLVGSRSPSGPRGRGGGVVRRSRFPEARAGRLDRREASLAAASGRPAFSCTESRPAYPARIAGGTPAAASPLAVLDDSAPRR